MLEIINQKYMQFLFNISKGPKNISDLARKGELTMSVASTLISRWAKSNVVNKQKLDTVNRGKETIITMTEYGTIQVNLLKELNRNYKKNKEMLTKKESDAVKLVSNTKGVENARKS